MSLETRNPRMVAFSGSAGAGSSGRLANVPATATGYTPGSVSFFEDFYGPDLATAGRWTLTNIAGTGTAGGFNSVNSTLVGFGALEIVTGAVANDTIAIDLTGRSTGGQTAFPLFVGASSSSYRKSLGLWRFMYPNANLTSTCHGFGWVNGTTTTIGTNWVTDPDTTFAGGGTAITGLVFTRHAASITGDGGDTGALVMRLYDAAGTRTTSAVALASSAIAANVAIKIEAFIDGVAGLLYVYQSTTDSSTIIPTNPTAIAGSPFNVSGIVSRNLRPSIQHQTTTGAARTIYHDLYYQEVAAYNTSGTLTPR